MKTNMNISDDNENNERQQWTTTTNDDNNGKRKQRTKQWWRMTMAMMKDNDDDKERRPWFGWTTATATTPGIALIRTTMSKNDNEQHQRCIHTCTNTTLLKIVYHFKKVYLLRERQTTKWVLEWTFVEEGGAEEARAMILVADELYQ